MVDEHIGILGGLIPVGSVGLVVTQTSTLTAMLQHGARMLVEFVAQLTSVERVMEYTHIETETNLFEGSKFTSFVTCSCVMSSLIRLKCPRPTLFEPVQRVT